MIKRIFDAHIHYDMEYPMRENAGILKAVFEKNDIEKGVFLSLPTRPGAKGESIIVNKTQNINGLFLKYCFSPDFYCYAGLVHKESYSSDEERSADYYSQVKEYYENGYDGIKMLEGCTGNRKAMKLSLCDGVYDRSYAFLEENGIPITMHVGNPSKMWDINRVGKWNLEHDRFFDETYPTKKELFDEVIAVMNKFPKLNLTLAHFGFTTEDITEAEEFFSFPSTKFDMTPGGEQYFNMLEKPDVWIPFLYKYSDRIKNGTDTYNVKCGAKSWDSYITNRPMLVKNFCDTDTEHSYHDDGETIYRGVKLEQAVIDKFFFDNAINELGRPKDLNIEYMLKTASALLSDESLDSAQQDDMRYIIEILQSGISGEAVVNEQFAKLMANLC